ncbi:MAG TPA: SMR family transporter [Candidatus Binatia bacterium]|nr:SMR family transporter [Candidatus Binatia bacterium]
MNRYSDLFLVLAAVGLNASAQLFLRKGMLGVGPSHISSEGFISTLRGAIGSSQVWSGLACYAVSVVLWLVVLSRVEVGRAYPLQGLGYIFVAVAGWWLLGETMAVSQMIGICVIWIGAYLLLFQ